MFVIPKTEAKPYEFKKPGSAKVYRIPPIDSIPYEHAMKFVDASNRRDVTAVVSAFAEFVKEFAPGAIDGLTSVQVSALVNDYLGRGESLGE